MAQKQAPGASDATVGKAAAAADRFFYGGQAVIEGVMIRGRRFLCVAVRRPNGQLTALVTPLSRWATGAVRRIPLLRGTLVLAETLVLGMKALSYSANASLEGEEKEELGRWSIGIMLALSLAFAVVLFFLFPLWAVQLLDDAIGSDFLSNGLEGLIRLGLFLAYVWAIGLSREIRRVFAYHGAEHMTVKAYEAREPLAVATVRRYSTAHPRCGTAFLLVVMVIAILVFALLGRPSMLWRVLSRVILIPVIAGLAYEVIRFSGAHQGSLLVRLLMAPSLLLQALTTRRPDDGQIEVAIHAMETALAADEGRIPTDAGQPTAAPDVRPTPGAP
ncbi:MAG: DUF1385 domain-containing protein [Chloroflexi bacterium]|nr:DUF1385 domain-containing protein [Chloroflexota bacterium]